MALEEKNLDYTEEAVFADAVKDADLAAQSEATVTDVSQTQPALTEPTVKEPEKKEEKIAPPPPPVVKETEPKPIKERVNDLYNYVFSLKNPVINNYMTKIGKDVFVNKIINDKAYRDKFYDELGRQKVKLDKDLYYGYFTPQYETSTIQAYSDEDYAELRKQQEQIIRTAQKKKAEIDRLEKNKTWYEKTADVIGNATKFALDAIKSGLDYTTTLAQKSDVAKALAVDKAINYLSDVTTNVQRGGAMGEAINQAGLFDLAVGSNTLDFDRIAKQMKDVKAYGSTNIEKDFEKHEGGWDTVSDYVKMIYPTVLESMVTLGRAGWDEIAAGAAGGAAVGGAPGALGGAAYGMAAAGYQMELFATIVDELEKAQYDVTSGDDWRKAFSNKEFISDVLYKANARAAIIGAVDLIGAGALGNVGSTIMRTATKAIPKGLVTKTGRLLQGISRSHMAQKTVEAAEVGKKLVEKFNTTKAGKFAQKAAPFTKDLLQPKDMAYAGFGEALAQVSTTGDVDFDEVLLESFGESKIIGAMRRLLKGSKPEAEAGQTPPPAGTPPTGPSADAVDEYEEVVTDEEFDEYEKTGKLHPDRQLAVDADAKAAMADPDYLEKTYGKDKDNQSIQRYLKMVTDAMDKVAAETEEDEILKASIAHVAETYGGLQLNDMAELINPQSPKFNKDIARAVEKKYTELSDAYAEDSGQVDVSTGTTQEEQQQQAPYVPPAGRSVEANVEEMGKLQEMLGKLDNLLATLPNDTPENQLARKKAETAKRNVENLITQQQGILQQQGYDSENISGVSSQVGGGQESQQTGLEQAGGTQEAGGSGVLQEQGQAAQQVITDEVRTIAQQELDPKNLVKTGALKYNKSKKPVYNGKTYTSTKALQAYLQTDEGIQEAAQTNARINDAINQSATFAETQQQGGQPVSQTISPGQTTTAMAGTPAVEGTEVVESSQQTSEGEKKPKVQFDTEGLSNAQKKRVKYLQEQKAIAEAKIKNNPDNPSLSRIQEIIDGYDKELNQLQNEAEKNKQKAQPETGGAVKPEGKPRVKGDGQEVVEAFEKAVAAGKKISFPVSGGKTTVQLDKPGQLKADENDNLYIDRGKGKREYLPAGGGEESVIRQQLGVSETAESKKKRKEAVAESNKKQKEKEEAKRKEAESKQIQKKKEYVARLQKVLDSGKDEKGNSINARQRKEAQATIDRLNADIAAAEGKPTEKKTETKTEQEKPKTEKQPQTKGEERLQRAIDGAKSSTKGTPLIPENPGFAKIGDIHNTGNRVLIKASLLADNYDSKIADNNGEGIEVYERVVEYGEMENGKLSKAPAVRIMIFNNQQDADAYFKERAAKNEKRINEIKEEVAKESGETKPAEKTTETKTEQEKPSGMPKEIQEAYARRSILQGTAQALEMQMRGKPLAGKNAQELQKTRNEIAALDQQIDAYEKSKQKPETKSEQKPEPKTEPVKEKVTELVGGTDEERSYGKYLIDQLVAKDPDGEKSRQIYIDGWNAVAKDKDSGTKANQSLEVVLVGMLPADKKATGYADIREAYKKQQSPETTAATEPTTKKSIIGSGVDGKGEPKKYAYQHTLSEFVDKAKKAVADGVFKVDIRKHGKFVTATLFNAVQNLQLSTFPAPTDIKGDLTNYATPILARELHETSVKNAMTRQAGQAISSFEKAINEGRMSAEDAKEIILSANQPLPDWLKQQLPAEEVAATTEVEQTPATIAAQELIENLPAEQYKPLTAKNIEIGKFSKDEALDYETDEKELDSGRMSEYISSMTVDVMDEDGNSIGNLIRLKDEDGISTYQATDVDGNELGKEAFDTKQEAVDALLAAHNKAQEKEFNKQQKKAEKERQKAEQKQKAKEPAPVEMVTPETATANKMFADADAIMDAEKEKRMSKAKQMREDFIATNGKETFDKINKITRNFEKIISDLEKEGKCTKKC